MQSTESSPCLLLQSRSFFDTLVFRLPEVFGIVSNIPLASTQVAPFQSFMLMSWWAPKMLQERDWLPEEPTMWLEGWKFSVQPSSEVQGRERDWRLSQSPMANDLINNAQLMGIEVPGMYLIPPALPLFAHLRSSYSSFHAQLISLPPL